MGLDLDIIDKNGEELLESEDLYFNYLRNPFGFHQFLQANFGVNIREYPFFPYHEDYENIFPNESRKLQMKTILEKIISELHQKKRLIWFFDNKKTLDQFFPDGIACFKYFTNDSFWKIIIPKADELKNIEDLEAELHFFFSDAKCLCGKKGCKDHSINDIINYNKNDLQFNKIYDFVGGFSYDEHYRDWIRRFQIMIELLLKEGNGYYISS